MTTFSLNEAFQQIDSNHIKLKDNFATHGNNLTD